MRAAKRLAAALCAGAAMLFLALPAGAERPDHAGPPEDRLEDPPRHEGEGEGRDNEEDAFVPAPPPPPPEAMTTPREPRREQRPEPRRRPRPEAPPRQAAPGPARQAAPEDEEPAATVPPEPAPAETERDRPRPKRADCPDAADVERGDELRSMEALCSGAPQAEEDVAPMRASSGGSPPTGPIAAFAAFALLAGLGMRALASRAR